MPHRIQTALGLVAFVAALILGSYLRTSELDLRPMHTDEAIQADRLGGLIERGEFDYNPEDGHGPGLLYLAAPVAKLAGASTYKGLNESIVRLAPALCGIALIAVAALFWNALGPIGVGVAALLAALSPMHVYYSRYFIMEVPMVLQLALFLFFLWRYLQKPGLVAMLLAGVCAGWMHATKETFAISIVALGVGTGAALAIAKWRGQDVPVPPLKPLIKHAILGGVLSLLVSAALYSQGFSQPSAIGESYATYLHYLDRSEGVGHEKPIGYYLELLSWKEMELFNWSEALILLLAAVGGIAAFVRRDLSQTARTFWQIFIIYAAATLLIYSLLAYKTPWSILCFLHACTLLAGFGFASALKAIPTGFAKGALAALTLFGCWALHRQDLRANFQFPANEDRNPYVYSHTTTKVVSKLVSEVNDELIAIKPNLIVQVFHPETGWPLPYYFRGIEKAGYYPTVTPPVIADVVIADANYSDELEPHLGDRYLGPTPVDLRDNVPLNYYIEKELFFEMVERRPVLNQ